MQLLAHKRKDPAFARTVKLEGPPHGIEDGIRLQQRRDLMARKQYQLRLVCGDGHDISPGFPHSSERFSGEDSGVG
ncbi:hypothetical protein MesoLjLa_43040 [Mesorhizobium sp. L-2-11]|nr:hypothetical protein MesoLjLa_43040 [Mesorhizobium sp. L-2-11]